MRVAESVDPGTRRPPGPDQGESNYDIANTSAGSRRGARTVGARRRPGWIRVVRMVGWTLVVAGAVVLEFAAYMVWGTASQAAGKQARLRDEFAAALEGLGGRTAVKAAVEQMNPEPGKPLARLRIPAIELDVIVVEGVGHEELRSGPGHIPETALPGRVGNSVISGHRTTYGGPFGDLDRLQPGAEILISTVEGETTYVVTDSYVVLPADTSVTAPLKPGTRPKLRLTTCHPKFSAAKRLVVEAELVSEPTGPDAPVGGR